MTNLYEISNSILSIEYDDDISEQAYFDTLESLEGDFEVKSVGIIAYLKNLGADSNAIKKETDRLIKKRKSVEKKIESIKRYLLQNLEKIGIKEVGNAVHSAKIRNNPASVKITDELIIDDKYFVIKKELSKKILKADLKNGEIIDGAELIKIKSLIIK